MQLEGIGAISVGHFFVEIRGQVDDLDGFVRTSLYTESAAYTEILSNE